MKQSDEHSNATIGEQPQSIEALQFDAPGSVDSTESSEQVLSGAQAQRPKSRIVDGAKKAPWWHSQFNLMLAVFGLLAVIAVLFVLLAPPPQVAQPDFSQVVQETIPDSEAPWSQSQRAQARNQAQTILADLLQSKKGLEEKGVEVWAAERFQKALDIAAQGDELYKNQEFPESVVQYQNAADEMSSLYDFLPALINSDLESGNKAIAEGKSALAKELFNNVLKLEPGNLAATTGLNRAQKLDQVLSLIAGAAEHENQFSENGDLEDLQAAEKKLLEAQTIDAEFTPVQEGLTRVQAAIVDKRFQLAMTDAYKALFANQYNRARSAFSAALKIKPGDKSAAAALQQSLASDKTASLATLLANAKRFEAQEEWASAQSNYQTVLQRDVNQVGAKLGDIRAGARKQLDTQLISMLSDTLSFGRNEQKSKAEALLRDAKAIGNKGPKLLQQIASLEKALAATDAVVKVSFLSDNLTDVSIQKIGSKTIKLGQFSQRNMALKPGRYVAIGVRLGYQDVRNEIDLYADGDAIRSITIKCQQPINVSAVKN